MWYWIVEVYDDNENEWVHDATYNTRRHARQRIRLNNRVDAEGPYPWKFHYRIRKYVPERAS